MSLGMEVNMLDVQSKTKNLVSSYITQKLNQHDSEQKLDNEVKEILLNYILSYNAKLIKTAILVSTKKTLMVEDIIKAKKIIDAACFAPIINN